MINVIENRRGNQRMDNPETLTTLDTQDTGQRQIDQKYNTANNNDEQHRPQQNPG